MKFHEYDVVRVTQDLPSIRIDAGSRQPQEGDIGTVVMAYPDADGVNPAYAVECVAEDGSTVWLADVKQSKLRLAQTCGPSAA